MYPLYTLYISNTSFFVRKITLCYTKYMKTRTSFKDLFPIPVKPPKPVRTYGPKLGYVVAAISTLFAVVHLIRIDTLVPRIQEIVPGGAGWGSVLVILIVMAEVFAVPFALRMKLSPAAHIMSGFQIIFAPLLWLLITIWAFGTDFSTGQFTSFLHTPSSGWLIAFNLAWLAFGFSTLWALGYNRLKLPKLK